MLSKSISHSEQVDSLSEFAQLFFTWTIPHLDDFGKIAGSPKTLKAIVMPMSDRPIEDFEKAIIEMLNERLISRYEVEGQLVIEYPGFDTYQTGLNKRTKSKYPDNPNSKKFSEVPRNSSITEPNGIELNRKEPNRTEDDEAEQLGDKNSSKRIPTINSKPFIPSNEGEVAAVEAWQKLEPFNNDAFRSYLKALKRGLPSQMFYEFSSEIKQDPSIRNPGAVFTRKVEVYFENKEQKS